MLLPGLHTDFSRGRSGGLVFPSLSEFSTVYCHPQSQRFGIVNKAERDVFLELSCFFDDPADVGNLISGSSAFSKTSLNIWMFSFHVLLKPGLENWSHYFMANRWGNSGNSDRVFSCATKSLQMMTAAMELKDACSLEEKL